MLNWDDNDAEDIGKFGGFYGFNFYFKKSITKFKFPYCELIKTKGIKIKFKMKLNENSLIHRSVQK